jgi:hypothetical protein
MHLLIETTASSKKGKHVAFDQEVKINTLNVGIR